MKNHEICALTGYSTLNGYAKCMKRWKDASKDASKGRSLETIKFLFLMRWH